MFCRRVSNEISESPKFREISRNVSVSFGQTFREISHNFGCFGTKDFAKFRSVSVGFGRIRNFGRLRNFRDVKTNARNFLWSMGCLARLIVVFKTLPRINFLLYLKNNFSCKKSLIKFLNEVKLSQIKSKTKSIECYIFFNVFLKIYTSF